MKILVIIIAILLVILIGLLFYGCCKVSHTQTIWEEVLPERELKLEDAEGLQEFYITYRVPGAVFIRETYALAATKEEAVIEFENDFPDMEIFEIYDA